jgi:hypothetical protein
LALGIRDAACIPDTRAPVIPADHIKMAVLRDKSVLVLAILFS